MIMNLMFEFTTEPERGVFTPEFTKKVRSVFKTFLTITPTDNVTVPYFFKGLSVGVRIHLLSQKLSRLVRHIFFQKSNKFV